MLLPDQITQRWFDSKSVTLEVAPDVPAVFDGVDLIEISGALANSKLTVRNTGLFISMEVEHFAVRKMWRELFFDIDKNCWVVYNRKFRIHEQYWGQDLAGRSIAIQARAGQRIGVGRLSTHAVGNYQTANHVNSDERWSGYWVWPRIGFDADIPAAIRPRLSPAFQSLTRLSDLLATEEGEREWYVQGDSVHVDFDLTAGSASWRTLERYTEKRGIRIRLWLSTSTSSSSSFVRQQSTRFGVRVWLRNRSQTNQGLFTPSKQNNATSSLRAHTQLPGEKRQQRRNN